MHIKMRGELEALTKLAELAISQEERKGIIHHHGNTAGAFHRMAMAMDGQLQGNQSCQHIYAVSFSLFLISDIWLSGLLIGER